jgi:hypothetical protein
MPFSRAWKGSHTMSNHAISTDAVLTPEQALLTDQIGNEVYA